MRAEQFEHITKPFILMENKPLKKSAQTPLKSKIINNAAHSSNDTNFEKYKGITKKSIKIWRFLSWKFFFGAMLGDVEVGLLL